MSVGVLAFPETEAAAVRRAIEIAEIDQLQLLIDRQKANQSGLIERECLIGKLEHLNIRHRIRARATAHLIATRNRNDRVGALGPTENCRIGSEPTVDAVIARLQNECIVPSPAMGLGT